MRGKLDAALAWAARGLRVFPLQENGKLPTGGGWTHSASTDPYVVRAMWTDPVTGFERDYNVAFLTTHHVVFDVDTKDGKPGLETFFRLGLDFGTTLTTRTPTGGYHLIFAGIGRDVGQSPLGPGIDVRSHNGYVVAPGSTIDSVPYVVEFDLPVADVPHELRPLLKAPRARRRGVANVELDLPENVAIAAHWLRREAAPAVQGMNGDDTTYRVCCKLRDYGVSEETALDLLLDEYNERCEPPWSPDEIARKVENAYQYAKGEAGAASPGAAFEHVVLPEAPPGFAARPDAGSGPREKVVQFGNMLPESDILPRPWVLEGLLMEGAVTALLAPGGVGKSIFSLVIAAHLAVGRPVWGFKPKRTGKSVVYNAEDDLAEVSRRLIAVCHLYDLDVDAVSSRVSLLGREDIRLKLTHNQPPQMNPDHVAVLQGALADPEVTLLALDPMVSVHTAKENDAIEMEYVMDIIRDVARGSRVPVLVVHHTGKPPNRSTSMSGEQDAGRGSTAITAAARVILTMYPARDTDCLDIGVPLTHRKKYVRVEGAKVSYGPNSTDMWLCWESHKLMSGDRVGVLVEHDAQAARRAEAERFGEAIGLVLLASGQGFLSINEVAAQLGRHMTEAEIGNRQDITKRLQRLFTNPAGGVILSEGARRVQGFSFS